VTQRGKQDKSGNNITIHLTQSLDRNIYDVPLTLKTYVPESWSAVKVMQTNKPAEQVHPKKDNNGSYVLYNVTPDHAEITLSKL
jgi:hypothetical protein